MKGGWRRGAAVAAVVVAGLFGAKVMAAGPPGGGCGGGGHALEHLERHVLRAGLPAATAQAVYQRIDQARVQRRTLEASLHAAHEQMRALLDQDGAKMEAVMAQADAVGALETQRRKLDLGALVEIRGLVTPEQWQALAPKRRSPGEPEGPSDERPRN